MAGGGLAHAGADARAREDEGRSGLDDVHCAVLARLSAEGVGLRVHDQVRRVRTVEELGDPLVGERVGELLRLDVGRGRVVCRVAGEARRLQLLLNGGDRRRILTLDRVAAHGLDDVILVAAICSVRTLEPHHPSLRPHLVGAIAIRGDEIRLVADDVVREKQLDRAVARLLLVVIEALAAGPLGAYQRALSGVSCHRDVSSLAYELRGDGSMIRYVARR